MMADEERCSPIIELYNFNTSTLPTTSQSFSEPGNKVNEVATVASATWSNGSDYSAAVRTEKLIEEALYRVVIVCVCVIGLVCNVINLLVLSRKSLTATMERLERSAHYGLVGKQATIYIRPEHSINSDNNTRAGCPKSPIGTIIAGFLVGK